MMSSGTQAKLPVIDFSDPNLKPGSPEWDLAKHQVRQAMEEYSCFEALFDQVVELRNEVMVALEEAFDLPLETKRLYVSDKHFYGYFESTTGLLESLMVDEAQVADSIEQGLTTTLWPQGNISFSKTLVSFTEVSSRLEKIIRRMILEIFGVDKYADELDDNTNYMLKLMKYNAPPYGKPTSGVFAHCDKNMVTLLYQNEVDGLQIQNKDGEWMNIKPSPDSFIVMVGESFNVGHLFITHVLIPLFKGHGLINRIDIITGTVKWGSVPYISPCVDEGEQRKVRFGIVFGHSNRVPCQGTG
ncbi:probable 2-oxoglutarate-dependent dioxygenase AOP1.2 [Hibiscus syriacus]|uniref:probable 2-oxoglutarate-dependent dioxygenase AOP1.2 n=1 Tax=Hibiscus syriacus TaxID=106335 RepID=UPI0019233277|nr:probable 2-oxoglutarate-dependent dioxygenase AOP1.2 [Hibiscus syriacus]